MKGSDIINIDVVALDHLSRSPVANRSSRGTVYKSMEMIILHTPIERRGDRCRLLRQLLLANNASLGAATTTTATCSAQHLAPRRAARFVHVVLPSSYYSLLLLLSPPLPFTLHAHFSRDLQNNTESLIHTAKRVGAQTGWRI